MMGWKRGLACLASSLALLWSVTHYHWLDGLGGEIAQLQSLHLRQKHSLGAELEELKVLHSQQQEQLDSLRSVSSLLLQTTLPSMQRTIDKLDLARQREDKLLIQFSRMIPHAWGGIREDTHCGADWPDGAGKFGSCPAGECCSREQWCGKVQEHCECAECMSFPIRPAPSLPGPEPQPAEPQPAEPQPEPRLPELTPAACLSCSASAGTPHPCMDRPDRCRTCSCQPRAVPGVHPVVATANASNLFHYGIVFPFHGKEGSSRYMLYRLSQISDPYSTAAHCTAFARAAGTRDLAGSTTIADIYLTPSLYVRL